MTPLVIALTLFILALVIGVAVIGRVPATLHTPLMSGANSIHGVVLIGVIIVAAHSDTIVGNIIIFFAALLGTLNVVGGYVVTDRMLDMFKPKTESKTLTDAITVSPIVSEPVKTDLVKENSAAVVKPEQPALIKEEKAIIPTEQTAQAVDLATAKKEIDDLLASLKAPAKTEVKLATSSKSTAKKPVAKKTTVKETAKKPVAKPAAKKTVSKSTTKKVSK